MKIILFEPQIPQNAGNVVRTCSVTNSSLVLVKPLGFSTSSRQVKRAGLDYWDDTNIEIIDDLKTYLAETPSPFTFFSSKSEKLYTEVSYTQESMLIFGSENTGLDPYFFETYPENFVTLPMQTNARCLNLSNAVAIGLYEALRQNNFNTCSI